MYKMVQGYPFYHIIWMHGYDRLSDYDKQLLNQHIVKLYSMLEDIYSQMK